MDHPSPLKILKLGLRPYAEVLEFQRSLQQALINGSGEDTLILCEHTPVITLGRSTKEESLLVTRETFATHGIEVFEIERGGDATFHGPGQLVAYPILDLTKKRRDVGWYMRGLEEVTIRTLSDYGVSAIRIPGKTGVWIDPKGPDAKLRKIASQGVRISRWKTLHGASLNVFSSKEGFTLINPCGFSDIDITSLYEELPEGELRKKLSLEEVTERFLAHFCEVFSYEPQKDGTETNSNNSKGNDLR